MSIKKLEKLLDSGPSEGLEKLVRRARDMDRLTTALRGALPPPLAENLVAASLADGAQLVVICASPAWASRIRFEADLLLEAARTAGFEATSMRVTVSHDSPR